MTREEIAKEALNVLELLKVTYGDVRVIHALSEHIATKDGTVEGLERNDTLGYGIPVLKNRRWGFAASNDLTKDGVYRTALKAVLLADAAAKVSGETIVLTKERKVKDTYRTPYKKDPFAVSLDRKLELLLAADAAQRKVKKVRISQAYFTAWKQKKLFANTEGSFIDQEIVECGGGIETTAVLG